VALAFFDLDRTLLSENSGSLWVRRELRLGHLTRWQAALASGALLRYHLGATSIESVLLAALEGLAGTSARELRKRTETFYAQEIRHLVRPGARIALEAHRSEGDTLVLLTTSSGDLADLISEELRLDEVLCNRLEAEGDRHTGRPQGELCYGPGKVRYAEALAEQLGGSLHTATFYSDSYSDLPMLEAVGRPVAVHPDPRLRREALRRGWPIESWGR
jgi:HAD superfamily hydrolase (TIGR01490 family)